MGFQITPPAEMDTPLKKWRWAMRWDEKLRLAHNWMGEWFMQGKTLAQYNTAMGIANPGGPYDNFLTRKIRTVFPYTPQLTQEQWGFFVLKHHQLTQALHAIMHEMRPAQPNPTQADMEALTAEAVAARGDDTIDIDAVQMSEG